MRNFGKGRIIFFAAGSIKINLTANIDIINSIFARTIKLTIPGRGCSVFYINGIIKAVGQDTCNRLRTEKNRAGSH